MGVATRTAGHLTWEEKPFAVLERVLGENSSRTLGSFLARPARDSSNSASLLMLLPASYYEARPSSRLTGEISRRDLVKVTLAT